MTYKIKTQDMIRKLRAIKGNGMLSTLQTKGKEVQRTTSISRDLTEVVFIYGNRRLNVTIINGTVTAIYCGKVKLY